MIRRGELVLDGWAGISRHAVEIVSETPKRYRITTVGSQPVPLAGRSRWLYEGETALVPKSAVQQLSLTVETTT